MVIKVCGIKTIDNINLMSRLKVEMVGLNFYPPSVRYISDEIDATIFDHLSSSTKRVGVFVNASESNIIEKAKKFKLDYIQLHGDEDLDFCKKIAESFRIIKVFRVDTTFSFATTKDYQFADYFLFDTATKNYGGSGLKFNWKDLDQYKGDTPFFLSGGIGPEDIHKVDMFDHPKYVGIDINSKFESEKGVKDAGLLIPFVQKLKLIF